MKILIVDDSLLDRKLIINSLKKANVTQEVVQAADGEEGLKILSEQHSDIGLILLDWQMPKVDGIAFMKGALSIPETAAIPIIMITASGSEENKREAKSVNPKLAGYVVKPYKAEKLIELVKAHLK